MQNGTELLKLTMALNLLELEQPLQMYDPFYEPSDSQEAQLRMALADMNLISLQGEELDRYKTVPENESFSWLFATQELIKREWNLHNHLLYLWNNYKIWFIRPSQVKYQDYKNKLPDYDEDQFNRMIQSLQIWFKVYSSDFSN